MTTEQAAAIRQALGELEETAAVLAHANATTNEIEDMFEALQRKLQVLLRWSEQG